MIGAREQATITKNKKSVLKLLLHAYVAFQRFSCTPRCLKVYEPDFQPRLI